MQENDNVSVIDQATGDNVEVVAKEYRNYKEERRARQVAFRPASAGTLKYQRIPMCGHKFVPGVEPRHRNCQSCWFTFFNVHGELTQSLDEVFSKFGETGLRQLKPAKFVKNFLRFMSTIAQWKEMSAAVKETNVENQEAEATQAA